MKISATKKVEIGVNRFHFMRVVLFRCFFPSPCQRRRIWLWKCFWVQVDFGFLSCFLVFFMSMIGLSRCFEYFFLCFTSKWGFKLKNLKSYFSSDLWLLNSAKANDVSSVVVADASPTHVVRTFKKLKKNKDRPSRLGSFWVFFFYFIFGLKKLIKTKSLNPIESMSRFIGLTG